MGSAPRCPGGSGQGRHGDPAGDPVELHEQPDPVEREARAPFHTVITAEETGAYKPQMKGFEYMLDKLGCGPEDITHVSSSFR